MTEVDTGEEEVTARLLRLAGAPDRPSLADTTRVRDVVHREWQMDRRRRRSRQATALVLGVAAVLMTAVWLIRPRQAMPAGSVVAAVERIQGRPVVDLSSRDAAPQPLSMVASIRAGAVVETDDRSRAALRSVSGASVRIDRGSRVRFLEPAVIDVLAGAAYVSTADGQRGFEVRTPVGTLRDVGTRFEVRLTGAGLQLRVRAGSVEVRRRDDVATVRGGTQATVSASSIHITDVAIHGSDWAWTMDVAPPFAIEGRPVRAFLEHVADEQGWRLHYADAHVADVAARTIIHGSVDGLGAEDALRSVLMTSGLRHSLRDGDLLVSGGEAGR